MAQKSTDDKQEILPDPNGSDLPSPPYWMTRRPPNAPPGPETTLKITDPGPAGAPPAAPPPTPGEIVEQPSRQAPIPAVGASGQRPQDSASAEPPKQYPPLPVALVSEPIFAFEWEDPAGSTKQQLTWTCLLQGFKNSPIIFGEALASNLDSFQPERFTYWLLQYVDDLLLAAENKEHCWEGTKALLELLMEAGYRVSRKKAQIHKEELKLQVSLPGSIT
ncbi:uncharacterized protein ACBT57_013729 isoform 2-T3 [Dama dama]|uniref:histone acetyltransferase p300-like isoform X2 n=1 Tax=Dama dama TaxID=30532 RepID=UPI002A360BE4|nr:histone acetyltransferase p300-like isoform X2 [Dama dama]